MNIHASLLPRWRGAAPVARAIEAGDPRTGVTLMQMEAGLDTGPMLAVESIPIGVDATSASLTDALASLGAHMAVRWLHEAIDAVASPAVQQPAEGITYASKIEKREAWLDWRLRAAELANRVRAFDPFPGSCGAWNGHTIKVWSADALVLPGDTPGDIAPGSVLRAGPDGIVVACGATVDGGARTALRLTCLQRPGGKRLDARQFLAGLPIDAGSSWTLTHDAT